MAKMGLSRYIVVPFDGCFLTTLIMSKTLTNEKRLITGKFWGYFIDPFHLANILIERERDKKFIFIYKHKVYIYANLVILATR